MGDEASFGVTDLSVRFGDRLALAGVSLRALPETVVAVVGGDGAGKTTLLRALAGTVRPASGRVHRPPATRTGYLPASIGIYPDLTVEENLEFSAGAYGVPAREARARVGDLIDRFGLSDARDRLGDHLSGGMARKLALAMATIHHPELLILDEPTTGLDPVSRFELWAWLARAAVAGTAVVFATTYLDEAERASDVLVLDEGTSLLSGSPDEIVRARPGALDLEDAVVAALAERRGGERT